MSQQQKEKRILLISFAMGLIFALAEFIFAIYSHSQSAMMDAAYDTSELVFIVLILFLTPLFYKPISEKRPYGFSQVESIFLVIKGFMMLSVTFSLSAAVIETALTGGAQVDAVQVSLFQLGLGIASIIIFAIMKYFNRSVSSPTVKAEILGWKQDILYSGGMSIAFFASIFLEKTQFAFISPYFDQIVTLLIVIFTVPDSIKMIWSAMKDVFLFSPDESTVSQIKDVCADVLKKYSFEPVFYDITRTGRRLWVTVYFEISGNFMNMENLRKASDQVNRVLGEHFENYLCELVVVPNSEEKIEINA